MNDPTVRDCRAPAYNRALVLRRSVGLESIAISNVAAGGSGDQAHVDRATRGGSQGNTHHRRPEFTRL